MNRLRVTLGLLLVGLLAVTTLGNAWAKFDAARRAPPDRIDDVTSIEDRCGRLRDQLPARGRVGYQDRVNDKLEGRRHALVQYSLAPLVVEYTLNRSPCLVLTGGDLRIVPAGGPK